MEPGIGFGFAKPGVSQSDMHTCYPIYRVNPMFTLSPAPRCERRESEGEPSQRLFTGTVAAGGRRIPYVLSHQLCFGCADAMYISLFLRSAGELALRKF